MSERVIVQRTTSNDPDFRALVAKLDHELWNELKEDQATYDQYNKVPDLSTVIVIYAENQPAAIGCFKQYDAETVEIKRMFVEKGFRGRHLSKMVLHELEKWAVEAGFRYAVLETSIHFNIAINLYAHAGYEIIENYDQYKGLGESVCMKKRLLQTAEASSDDERKEDLYFRFESDFVEREIRCIPMIVRFKMDKAGIKLKLAEWNKFNTEERIQLATRPCDDTQQTASYHSYLASLVHERTGDRATGLLVEEKPEWDQYDVVPQGVQERSRQLDVIISTPQWKKLTSLQRFALVKLARPGHESKNFIKAMGEFGLMPSSI